MPPNSPFKARVVKPGKTTPLPLVALLIGVLIMLVVTMVLLFRTHHQYDQKSSSGEALRHIRNSYIPSVSEMHLFPVREVIKKQQSAIDQWALREDTDHEMEGQEEHEEQAVPPLLPDRRSIHTVIKELFYLGKSDPEALLRTLQEDNPLGIPKSSQDPLDEALFRCPLSLQELLSLPDLVNHTRAHHFREGRPGSWLLYQHLRKAGGTGFCDLAKRNLKRGETPPYYCMVDRKGSLATHPWNQETKVLSALRAGGGRGLGAYRMTSNEWDVYERRMGAWEGAVLATTFRHPVDRYYSQYRFEHLERRDGSSPDAPRRPFQIWYKNNHANQMGSNYYTRTFIGEPAETAEEQQKNLVQSPRRYQDFYWSYHQFRQQPLVWEQFNQSLSTVRGFHLVLVTEWLNSASKEIEDVLGWKIPPKRVLPHQSQASRKAADMDVLAAQQGSEFESYVEQQVGREVYRQLELDNVFDVLLFHCAKRLYMERLRDCASQQ